MYVFSYTVGIQCYEKQVILAHKTVHSVHEKKKKKTNGQHLFSTNDKLVGGFEFPF